MNRSLRWKFVIIMLTLIVVLMTIVCVTLIWGVQKFYSDAFFDRMKDVFNTQMYTALQKKLTEDDPVGQLEIVLDAYQGQLGIDTDTRNYYILDDTGAVLATSAADTDKNIEMTPNLLTALTGGDGYTGRSNAEYMDVAVPIKDRAGDTAYVVYILDNSRTCKG